jgi:hypothetical protein
VRFTFASSFLRAVIWLSAAATAQRDPIAKMKLRRTIWQKLRFERQGFEAARLGPIFLKVGLEWGL